MVGEILTEGSFVDDRRRVVNIGRWDGRDVVIENMQALAVGGANLTWNVIATRGERVALSRIYSGNGDRPHEEFGVGMLGVVEIDAAERIEAHVVFDPDDIDAAFKELDARYVAGEAAIYAHAWSVIAGTYAAFNRRELPAAHWNTIDHRSLVAADTSDMPALIRSVWDLTPDLTVQIEAVHRLSGFGAVVALTAYGTSPQGFDAEWRMIQLPIVNDDRVNGCEIFDEADVDAALARFEELQPQAPRLENAASRLAERFQAHFVAGDGRPLPQYWPTTFPETIAVGLWVREPGMVETPGSWTCGRPPTCGTQT